MEGVIGDQDTGDLAVLGMGTGVQVVPAMDLAVIVSMARTKNKIIETKKNSSPKRAVLLASRYCYHSYITNRLVVFIIQIIQIIHV